MIKDKLNAILNKKMDRKGFLKHVLFGFVAVMGIGAVLRVLGDDQKSSSTRIGYGGGAYGGSEDGK